MEKQKTDTVFKSRRLYARPLHADDLKNLIRLNGNAKVMEFIAPPMDEAACKAYLEKNLAYAVSDPGYGKFAVHERKTGEFIGFVALQNLDKTQDKELGYRLLPHYWKRGYGTEISRAAIEYGFWEKELDKIVAIAPAANQRSIHVIEKCGFRYKRIARFYDTEVQYFVMKRKEWEKGRGD